MGAYHRRRGAASERAVCRAHRQAAWGWAAETSRTPSSPPAASAARSSRHGRHGDAAPPAATRPHWRSRSPARRRATGRRSSRTGLRSSSASYFASRFTDSSIPIAASEILLSARLLRIALKDLQNTDRAVCHTIKFIMLANVTVKFNHRLITINRHTRCSL